MVSRIRKFQPTAPIQEPVGSVNELARQSGTQVDMPAGITQKKAIEKLIPHLFVLRGKGCSWGQITNLLNGKCGFKLKESTVRVYFGQMARRHIDICRAALVDHHLTAAEVAEQERLPAARKLQRVVGRADAGTMID